MKREKFPYGVFCHRPITSRPASLEVYYIKSEAVEEKKRIMPVDQPGLSPGIVQDSEIRRQANFGGYGFDSCAKSVVRRLTDVINTTENVSAV